MNENAVIAELCQRDCAAALNYTTAYLAVNTLGISRTSYLANEGKHSITYHVHASHPGVIIMYIVQFSCTYVFAVRVLQRDLDP